MNWIKGKVVMLPSNKMAAIVQESFLGNKRLVLGRTLNIGDMGYHLYFTSDEEIKEGDWFICNQSVQQCIEVVKGDYPYKIINRANGEEQYHSKHWKDKVIVATDKSLGLPEPSKGFLEVYVDAYNEGKKIEEVLIEVEEGMDINPNDNASMSKMSWTYVNRIKVKPNNTITIKKVKDSWNRKEVIDLLNKLGYDLSGNGYILDSNLKVKPSWIERNL